MIDSDINNQESKSEEDIKTTSEVNFSEIIIILRNRANSLKRNASISLFLIFITLCSGMYIFIFAIQLTEIKTFVVEDTDFLQRGRKDNTKDEKLNLSNDSVKKYMQTHQSLNANQQFVSMIINKIGALMILFFIVKLFINLYRYNIILSGYYDSRADVLQIANEYDVKELNTFTEFITPEKIDFGKTPNLPIEQAITLVKEVSSGLKK